MKIDSVMRMESKKRREKVAVGIVLACFGQRVRRMAGEAGTQSAGNFENLCCYPVRRSLFEFLDSDQEISKQSLAERAHVKPKSTQHIALARYQVDFSLINERVRHRAPLPVRITGKQPETPKGHRVLLSDVHVGALGFNQSVDFTDVSGYLFGLHPPTGL